MKQETGKKSKKLLWLIIALAAIVAVAGVLLGIFWSDLFGGDPAGTAAGNGELYWNVDRITFVDEETGMSNRVPDADGMFAIRFAHDGQIVELKVAGDKKLVNFIDTMDAMGLVFDANGMIVDAIAAKDVATEVVKDNYVSEVGGGFIRVNSAMTMTGMSNKIKLTENTKIFDVSVGANPVGQVAEPKLLDCVTAYADADGNVTTIFITKRVETGGIYYIFGTQYDSALKETTRVPDENGVYTFTAAHEGAQVELKCRDKAVMSTIDSANGLFGLKLDDEGYVVKKLDAASAMLGIKEFVNYTITELDGDTFTATRFMAGVEQGNTFTGTLREDADVFIVEDYCTADFIGQRTELQMGDRVDLWTDLEGNPMLLTIVSRKVDSPMYWNISQSYNYSTKETNRKPDENDYYHVSMVVNGKEVELRTKDKALMTKIDEKEEKAVGLKLKGDIIQAVYNSRCVCGLWGAGTNRYITATSGNVIQMSKTRDWTDSANYVLPKTCNVYDVSGYYGVPRGTKTTVQKFDCVTAFQNESGELTDVFIVDRYVEDAKIYYNYNRVVGRKDGITTRSVVDGYYVFDMACEGKQVQVKTKNAEMATWIDSQWPNYVALTVKKDGTIKNAYPARAAVKGGHQKLPGNTVKEVTKDGILKSGYRNETTGIISSSTDLILAKDYKVYNCSLGYEDHLGEKTKLKVGDQFATVCAYPSGEVVEIYIMRRQVDSPLYWHYNKYATKTVDGVTETTRPVDADGYYVFELIDNGEIVTLKTKDKALATQIDSNSQAFCLTQNKGIIKKFYGPTVAAPDTTRYGVGSYDIMSYDEETRTVVAKRNRPQASDYGTESKFVLRKDEDVEVRIINVDSTSPNFGKKDEIHLGDRITTYRDPEGRATYVFIQYKNTHEAGHVSYCEHCDQEVFWEPYIGEFCRDDTYAKTTTFHYYVVDNREFGYGPGVGHRAETEKNYEIVLDLNGKTYCSTKNGMTVYTGDALTILDTVGGGKLTAKMDFGTVSGDPGVIVNMGTVNLLSGTICPAEGAKATANAGTLYNTGSKAVLNIYGGTVTGGKLYKESGATFGGNIHLSNGATFNMYGGFITNGDAGVNGYGGNVNISTGSKANIYGGKIVGGKAANGGNISIEINKELDAYLNIYGGEITGGIATNQGGNLRVFEEDTGKGLKLNITGGKILGGTAKSGGNLYLRKADAVLGGEISGGKASTDGDNMYIYTPDYDTVKITGTVGAIAADSTINDSCDIRSSKSGGLTIEIDGATIVGEMVIPSAAKLKLTGAPKIGSLKLSSGYLVELGQLSNGASISIDADGAFTAATDKAEAYQAYFSATAKNKFVTVKNGALTIETKVTNNGALELTGNVAKCPVCYEDVEWTALALDAANNLEGGKHYYLTGDAALNSTTYYMLMAATGETCVHLNGHNITLTGGATVLDFAKGASSTVNFVGTGNVKTTSNGSQTLTMGNGGKAVLYGGTYSNAGTGPVATIQTATLIVEKTATVVGANGIKLAHGNGGSTVVINGAKVDNIDLAGSEKNKLTLNGAPVISNLSIKEGYTVALGALEDGADIGVTATGVFTKETAQAEAYKKYFTSRTAGKIVEVEGKTLTVVDAPINNDNLQLDANNVANCSLCGKDVEWIALPLDAHIDLEGGKHYYLNGKATYSETGGRYMTMTTNGIACIHLNGNEIELSSGAAVLNFASGSENRTVRFFGNGDVYTTSSAGLFDLGQGGNIALYSGTYYNKNTNGASVILQTGILTVKDGVEIGTAEYPSAIKLAHGAGGSDVRVEGGEIKQILISATPADKPNNSLKLSGAPVIGKVTVPEGNTIKLGELKTGAYIKVEATGAFTGTLTNAESYLTYFDTVSDAYEIKAVEGTLAAVQKPIQYGPELNYTQNLEFSPDVANLAWCAACGKHVEWTPWDGASNLIALAGKHYYLTQDANANFWYEANGETCLHLNGKNWNREAGTAINVAKNSAGTNNPVLNILGSGNVSGNGGYGATIYAAKGQLNLYSGNYTKNAAATGDTATLLRVNNDAQVYLGKDVTITGLTAGETVVYSDTAGCSYVVDGATINGSVSASGGQPITLSGAPKISGLVLKTGCKITLGELATGAEVFVQFSDGSNGQIAEANENAATYVNYIKAFEASKQIVNNQGVLTIEKVPTVTDPLGLPTGSNTAYCPVCADVKEWTALTLDANNALEAGKHYYLTGDAGVTEGNFMTMAARGTVCVHLNGKNITCANGSSVFDFATGADSSSVVNLMGSGNVTTESNGGQTLHVGFNGNLVLHSGTYKNSGTAPVVNVLAGSLTVKADAVIQNNGIEINADAAEPKAYVEGGNISNINFVKGTLELSGAPVIDNLTVASGKLVTLGELVDGAVIRVNATGDFTEQNANAESYMTYITGLNGAVTHNNGVLTMINDPILIEIQKGQHVASKAEQMMTQFPAAADAPADNAAEPFKADCPACGAEDVAWYARGAGAPNGNAIGADESKHYYLVGDLTKISVSGNTNVCVHLNGYNVTSTDVAINAGGTGTLNIMGQGIVAGSDASSATAAFASATDRVVNLYGGTYKQGTGVTNRPVFTVSGTGAVLNVYGSASITGVNTANSAYSSAMYITSGTVNVYGGEITGTKGNGALGEVIRLNGGNLNIHGGTIGVTAVNTKASIHAQSGTLTISGAPVIDRLRMAGATLNLGELTEGASIGYRQASEGTIATGKGEYVTFITAYMDGYAVTNVNGDLTYAAAPASN